MNQVKSDGFAFFAFFAARKSINREKRKERETVLGLAISRRIGQRHIGLLTIENTLHGGAKATVKLPLSQN